MGRIVKNEWERGPTSSERQEQPREVIVDDLALRADREVRSDQALRPAKLAVAAGDLPDHGTTLHPGHRAGTQETAADGLEGHLAGGAVRDTSALEESALRDDLDLGLERRGLRAAPVKRSLNAIGLQRGPKRLIGGNRPGAQLVRRP